MSRTGQHNREARALLTRALREPASLSELGEAQWDLLLRVSRRARLLARLDADVQDLGLHDQVPSRAAEQLRAARVMVARRQQLARWEVDRLLWALAEEAQPFVLLKGTAYLMGGLPPARGRLFADVDLMVADRDLERIERSLSEQGWQGTKQDAYDQRYYREWMHELPPMRHVHRETEVDLHHDILPRTSRLHPNANRLLEAARPLAEEPRLRVLAPHDMVLHAMTHLFYDGDMGDALRELVDIDDLLRHFGAEPDFWEGLVPRAERLELVRPLHYGLRYARRILGTPVPDAVQAATREGRPPAAQRWLMDRLVPLALFPEHPDHPRRGVAFGRWLLYLRSHWLRMPPLLLARHLFHKAFVTPRTQRG